MLKLRNEIHLKAGRSTKGRVHLEFPRDVEALAATAMVVRRELTLLRMRRNLGTTSLLASNSI